MKMLTSHGYSWLCHMLSEKRYFKSYMQEHWEDILEKKRRQARSNRDFIGQECRRTLQDGVKHVKHAQQGKLRQRKIAHLYRRSKLGTLYRLLVLISWDHYLRVKQETCTFLLLQIISQSGWKCMRYQIRKQLLLLRN